MSRAGSGRHPLTQAARALMDGKQRSRGCPTSPETHEDQGPSETTAEPAPRRSAIASRVGKTRAPAPRDEHPLFKRDLVKVNVRMTREDRDELHIYARRNGKSVQTLLEEFVRKILKTIERSRGPVHDARGRL